jgi:hypothetical protein
MACFQSMFEGYPLRIAHRDGKDFILRDDFVKGIGDDMTGSMRAFANRLAFKDQVMIDGLPREEALLTLDDFHRICQIHPSKRLDGFRDRVARILSEIHYTGRYNGPPPAEANLPAQQLPDDPILMMIRQAEAMRLKQLETEKVATEAKQAAQAAETKAQMAHDMITGYHGWFTLGTWAPKVAGISLSEAEARCEAQDWLVPKCKERGISRQYASSPKYVSVRVYPEALLWEWAEDYARRHPECGFKGRRAS